MEYYQITIIVGIVLIILEMVTLTFIFLGVGIDSFKSSSNYGISYSKNISLDNINPHNNIGNIIKSLSDNIDTLVRTNSKISNCPELVRSYTEPCFKYSFDNKKIKKLDEK